MFDLLILSRVEDIWDRRRRLAENDSRSTR